MNEPTPLPCPFCGQDPFIDRENQRLGVLIRCFNIQCPAKPSVSHQYEDVALHSWNTRHTPDPNAAPKADASAEKAKYLKSRRWTEFRPRPDERSTVYGHHRQSGSCGPCELDHAWETQIRWDAEDSRATPPKVDEQLEDLVHSLKNIATDPLNNLNVVSDVRDIVFAKAILHLLKR